MRPEKLAAMSDLVFSSIPEQGGRQEWKLTLPRYTAGRGTGSPAEGHLSLAGDALISRQHFELIVEGEQLRVRRLPSGRNPIFYEGQECDDFVLPPGETFVVGQTRCTLSRNQSSLGGMPTEFTLLGMAREEARERSSYECFQALMDMLPRLRRSTEDETIWKTALDVLRNLLPEASTLMVLQDGGVLHCQGTPVSASRRLVARAHSEKCTVTHCWEEGNYGEATMLEQVSWAVASPAEGYTLYAVGNARASDLQGRAVLLDVVAETVGHYLALQRFQRLHSQVGQFFSPVLRSLLTEQEFREVLQPRRAEVTVLFFDLRGFSQATESAEDSLDEILAHHETLTRVMTEITECIFQRDGVVIDYQGDAILACWGAPRPQPDHALQAVEAGRAILSRVYAMDLPFKSTKGGRNLRCGLGLGTGEVIAGQVGARDQTKFGIMGKVVNQASRLEGLTKQLGVPMLINAELQRQLPQEEVLCRCVGNVRPAGLREAAEIYEPVVAESHGGSGLSPAQVEAYHRAYAAYREGEFFDSLEHLRDLPVTDPIGAFLNRQVLARQDEDLPAHWDGVLEFRSK
jgi:adenylate cyclase